MIPSRKRLRQLAAIGLAAAMAATLVVTAGLLEAATAAEDAAGELGVSQSPVEDRTTSVGAVLEALAQAAAQGSEAITAAAAQEDATASNETLLRDAQAALKARRYEEAEEKLKAIR